MAPTLAGVMKWEATMRKAYTVASCLLAAAAIPATLWSPAVSDELLPMKYKVTVLEQVHHEITVEVDEERAARTVALLEARRTSGLTSPAWKPWPRTVLAHEREANDFAVVDIEPLPSRATPETHGPFAASDNSLAR
jgi:phospholipase C